MVCWPSLQSWPFKELGVPLPIPSDLIMITAGAQAAAGAFTLFELLIAIEIAMVGGGTTQFLVARGAGRKVIYRFGRYVGLTSDRLDQASARLGRRGVLAVFVGLNVPGARAGIIPAAGLAGLPYPAFVLAMIAGSTLFYSWHVALGYVAGPSATTLLASLHLPVLPVIVGLALLGLIGWLILRIRHPAQPGNVLDRVHTWTEAACPACLAATAITNITDGRPHPDGTR